MVRMTTILSGGRNTSSETIRTEIKTELKDLDPDKYIGTIGVAADAPKNAVKKHYTRFPDEVQAGNWVRVVSETTIEGKSLLIGEEWICVAERKDKVPPKWESMQAGKKLPLFASYEECIGDLRRRLDTNRTQITESDKNYFPIYFLPLATGVFNIPSINSSPTILTPLLNLVQNGVSIDFYAFIQFAPDNTGLREIHLRVYTYYPSDTDLFETPLDAEFAVDDRIEYTQSPVVVFRPRVRLPIVPPLDDKPLTYAVSLYAFQNSGVPLSLTNSEIKLVAWK